MEILLLVFIAGYIVQDVASVVLLLRIRENKSIRGLSLESQIMYFVGTVMRLIYVFDTRLSNERLIWIELTLSLTLFAAIFYEFYRYRAAISAGVYERLVTWKVFLPVCLLLSYFFHPGTKNDYGFTPQQFVSCSMFLEACALLPQILIIRRAGEVDKVVGKYIVCMALSRVLRLAFWVMMYIEGDQFVYLIAADVVHTLILCDFVYIYFSTRAKSNGMILIY